MPAITLRYAIRTVRIAALASLDPIDANAMPGYAAGMGIIGVACIRISAELASPCSLWKSAMHWTGTRLRR